jgi:hypothetical protein
MMKQINEFIDTLSDFFAYRKGLLPLIGLVLIILNLLLQFFPGLGWITSSNLFLHLGAILAVFGFMLAWAL